MGRNNHIVKEKRGQGVKRAYKISSFPLHHKNMKQNILFASDLDNTLLFSYKYKKETDQCVEYLDGQEQGFFTQKSIALLGKINQSISFVPVTSRSIEQYQRIQFPKECTPNYAVTTNGAILLVNGEIDSTWYQTSIQSVKPWYPELHKIHDMLSSIPEALRYRMIDEMYLFAACECPEDAQRTASHFIGQTKLEVAVSGRKVYFFPPSINKGCAIERLKTRFKPTYTISAGDTIIDVPMLLQSDLAIIPDANLLSNATVSHLVAPNGIPFSDFILTQVLHELS